MEDIYSLGMPAHVYMGDFSRDGAFCQQGPGDPVERVLTFHGRSVTCYLDGQLRLHRVGVDADLLVVQGLFVVNRVDGVPRVCGTLGSDHDGAANAVAGRIFQYSK